MGILSVVTGCGYEQGQSQPEKYDTTKDGDEAKEDLFTDCLTLQREDTCIKTKC